MLPSPEKVRSWKIKIWNHRRRSMRGREVRKEISKELDAIQGVGSNLSQFQKLSFVYCKCSSQEEIGA
jgi:hypothetical protein